MFIYARLKIKLFVFVFRKQTTSWQHFGKETQCGIVLWEMLTKLFVRSYFQQKELLIYFLISDCKLQKRVHSTRSRK
jgi:hypothetical protein